MKVKIKATGYGATALKDGTILHFDVAEKKAKEPDKRKLEAEVEIEDARRIKELGWGDFKDVDEEDGERAELGTPVNQAEEPPAPEPGKPAQVPPPLDRDSPERNARLMRESRPKRPSELRKAAEKKDAKAKANAAQKKEATPTAPASPPAPTAPAGEQLAAPAPVDGDPEAGPA